MGKTVTLTSTEKAVLHLLTENSRLSFSQMGLKIKKSQQLVSSTVKALTDKKIIKKYYTLIDYSRLGVLNFRVYFKLSYSDTNRVEKFIEYLTHHSHVSWLVNCGGKFDLICSIYALNPSQFNKCLKHIIMKFSKLIKEYTLLTTIVMRIFRSEISSDTDAQEIFIGGDRERIVLKDADVSILQLISENARIPSVEIGNKLHLTPKTIISHIKKLEAKKIICGYTTQIETKKVRGNSIILLIKYHNTFVRLEEQFIEYLKAEPEVTRIIKTLGEWDLEIMLTVEDRDQFRIIELNIKEKFASLIHDTQNITIYEERKIDFFPKIILEKRRKAKTLNTT